MRIRLTRSMLLAAIAGGAAVAPLIANAQTGLTGVILSGGTSRSVRPAVSAPALVTPGTLIRSPNSGWTEIALSDGTSIVLEPGADFTLISAKRNADGRWVVVAKAERGRVRIAAADNTEVHLFTQRAEVIALMASAVVDAGASGSVTLLSGGTVTVRRGAREDVLRRSGFAIVFDEGGPQRRTREQMAGTVNSFGPVTQQANTNNATYVADQNNAVQYGSNRTVQNASNAIDTRSSRISPSTVPATTPAVTASQTAPLLPPTTIAIVTPTIEPTPIVPIVSQPTPIVPVATPPTTEPTPIVPIVSQPTPIVPVATPPTTEPTPTVPVVTPQGPPPPVNASFNIAQLLLPSSTTPGTGIAAPGSSVATSSTAFFPDGQLPPGTPATDKNLSSDQSDPTVKITSLQSVDFGAARIRRMPGGSGVATTDTQLVPSGDSLYVNLSKTSLPTINDISASNSKIQAPVFYDATGYVGYMNLGLSTGNSSTLQSNVYLSDATTPNVTTTLSEAGGGTQVIDYALPAITRLPVGGSLDAGQVPVRLPAGDGNNDHSGLILYVGPPPSPTGGSARSQTVVPPPTVYIIDKVTVGIPERGIAPGERLFAIGGTSVGDGQTTGLPGIAAAGNVIRYAISDGLNPQTSAGLSTTQPLPDQFLNPAGGTLPAAFTNYNAFRPENTFASSDPTKRGDTQLLIVSGDTTRPNVAMRTDLQILGTDAVPDGRASASVSVGGITVSGTGSTNPLALTGATVGSTRLATNQLSAAITSNFGSLSTAADGQGAQLLGGAGLNGGQISYFAVSQANPSIPGTVTPAAVQPGYVEQVGAASQSDSTVSQYGYTRLATNVGTPTGVVRPDGAVTLQGFASAVVDRATPGNQTVYAVSTKNLGDMTISRAAGANTFSATTKLAPTSVGQSASDPNIVASPSAALAPTTLTFGDSTTPTAGTTPRSAFVSNRTFAAVGATQGKRGSNIGANVAMASVDGDLLQGIQNRGTTAQPTTIPHPDSGVVINASLPASNKHVAWGLFLGDLVKTDTEWNHVNLGFWVAGVPVGLGTLQTLTGSATYAGGMVGTAVDANARTIKTVVGQFAQTWDFTNRTGKMNAAFDGARWTGVQTNMPTGSPIYSGSGTAGDRTLSVNGTFFHAGPPIVAGSFPAATGGTFGIQNTAGSYGANGIFVGKQSR